MRVSALRPRRSGAPVVSYAALLAILAAPLPAGAQAPSGGSLVPPWLQGQPAPAQAPAPAPATPVRTAPAPARPRPAAGSRPIARVGERIITQADFDRVAGPYFARLRAQLGAGFSGDIERMASFNVLDQLVRRQLLVIEAHRLGITSTQAEVDSLLLLEPMLQTNGRPDLLKLQAFKTSPASNYVQVLPLLHEMAASSKLDATLRRRFAPTPAEVRAEWDHRYDQVRIGVLPLLLRDMPLDSEATDTDCAAYYAAHPEEFTRRARVRLRFVQLALPPAGDSTLAAAEAAANARAEAIADSLRRGTLADTAAEFTDTGLFDVGIPYVPRLGREPALAESLAAAQEDTTRRLVGPYRARGSVVVVSIAERQPRHLPPYREVRGDVQRRANADRRRVADDAARHALYTEHPERWRTHRAAITRLALDASRVATREPLPAEIERWYADNGSGLLGIVDGSPPPPLMDSVRTRVRERLEAEQRSARAAALCGDLAEALRSGRDVRGAARGAGATLDSLYAIAGAGTDSLFGRALLDSLAATLPAGRGTVGGPRAFGNRWAVWRTDAVDTAFVPPYDLVHSRVEQALAEERRHHDEEEGRAYLEQHPGEFLTPVRYALDIVAVPVVPPDSVRVSDADVRRQYDAHPARYRQDEQVHARHILFLTQRATPEQARRARARADSVLAAIRAGANFAEMAKRFSEDPGSAPNGGDVRWFGRGAMVPEFEQAAFRLKPGEVSEPVKTAYGWHLIQVEEHRAAGVRPFAEVRDEIRATLARARADSTARRTALALCRQLARGGDAHTLAAPFGGVTAVGPVAASDALPSFGVAQGLSADLPGLEPGTWAASVYRAGDHVLVLRVREREAPRPAAFDEVRAQATEAAKNARRRIVLDRKAAAIRASLAAGVSLDSLSLPYGGLKDGGPMLRGNASVPGVGTDPRVIERAFAMKQGEVSDTLQVPQGVLWMRVLERKSGDAASYAATAATVESELLRKRFDAWIDERRKTVRVEILRPDLKAPRPAMLGAPTGG